MQKSSFPKTSRHVSLVVLAYLLLVVLFVQVPTFHDLKSPDGMKYANVARSILEGRGAYSDEVYPINLAGRQMTKLLPASQIRSVYSKHYLYPLILAAFFQCFGVNDFSVFLCAALFWVLAGWLMYRIGARCFSPRAGIVAMFVFSTQTSMIAYTVGGVSEPLCMTLMLSAGLLLITKDRRFWPAFCAGLVLCAGLYVRQAMLYILPLTCLTFLLFDRGFKIRRLAGLAAGFLVMSLMLGALKPVLFPPLSPFDAKPMLTETSQLIPEEEARSPEPGKGISTTHHLLRRIFGISYLSFSEKYPLHALERTIHRDDVESADPLEQILSKAGQNMPLMGKVLLYKLGTPLLGLFFVIGMILTWQERPTRILTLGISLMLGVTAVVCMILFVMDRYFQIVMPFMALVVGNGAVTFARRFSEKLSRIGIIIVLTVFSVAITYPWLFAHFLGYGLGDQSLRNALKDYSEEKHVIGELLRENTEPEAILFSDIPWITAWYANRPSIWTPLKPADAEELARWVDVRYLFLSLNDPHGFFTWRDWLRSYGQREVGLPLGDWRFIAGRRTNETVVYLFARPESPSLESGEAAPPSE